LVDIELRRYSHDLTDTDLDEARAKLGAETISQLFFDVGEGRRRAADVAAAAFPGLAAKVAAGEGRTPIEERRAQLYVQGGNLTPGVSLHFAPCCSPIPGDRIVGVPTAGEGMVIHTIDCETLAAREEDADSWVDLGWTETARQSALAVGRITASVQNGRGVLAQLTKIIAENEGDILNIKAAQRQADFFDVVFDIQVTDAKHLTNILAALRTSKSVREVERVRG
jgi:GTP pyrophosphokinase/guanosine-3',5'-bis(diphosphate) 3'-pyrophosphohydrolase